MSLGEKLRTNIIQHEINQFHFKLKDAAKEMNEFLENSWNEIVKDIEDGCSIEKIEVPTYLDFQHNYHKVKDQDYIAVVRKFQERARNEQIEVDFIPIPDDDFARYGDYDFWITVKPYFPPAPDKD